MPILGTIASSRRVATGDTGSMFPISSFTIPSNGSIQEINFTSIPQTFTHLQIRGVMVGTDGSQDLYTQVNGVTSAGYAWHEIRGNGNTTAVSTNNASNTTQMFVISNATNSSATAAAIVDILDYRNTNKNKTIRSIAGRDFDGSTSGSFVTMFGGVRLDNSAITSIRLFIPGAFYFNTGSTFALYGVNA